MLIVCPQCATSYKVAPSALGTAGRTVRCVRCRNVWFAPATAPVLEAATVDANPDPTVPTAVNPQAEAAPVAAPVTEYVTADAPPSEIAEAAGEQDGGQPPTSSVSDADADKPAPVPAADEPAAIENEIIDPAIVAEAPSIVPPIAPDPLPEPHADLVTEDVESFAARRARLHQKRRKAGWSWPSLPVTILGLIAIVALLLGWRAQIVRFLPQTSSFYEAIGLPVNVRGLEFQIIKSTREMHEGIPVLVVEGRIIAIGGRTVEVPRLRFAVRNESGKEIYSWTAKPSRTLLAPGETLPFRSRLASPPAEGRDVSVRFFTRRDALAGAR